MDCDLCQIRGSIGFCAECKRLLCELCGIGCTECGRYVCVTHVYETHSGKKLCSTCTKARKQRHKHAEERKTSFMDLDDEADAVVGVHDEAPEEERAILTASAYQPMPAWKLSLYLAGAAGVMTLVILFIPGFRLIAQPWCSLLAMAVCLLSGFWAVVGLTSPRYPENRGRNFIGLGVAVAAVLLSVVALKLDANTRGDNELEAGMLERQGMSAEELQQWRRERLDKFTPKQPPEGPTQ